MRELFRRINEKRRMRREEHAREVQESRESWKRTLLSCYKVKMDVNQSLVMENNFVAESSAQAASDLFVKFRIMVGSPHVVRLRAGTEKLYQCELSTVVQESPTDEFPTAGLFSCLEMKCDSHAALLSYQRSILRIFTLGQKFFTLRPSYPPGLQESRKSSSAEYFWPVIEDIVFHELSAYMKTSMMDNVFGMSQQESLEFMMDHQQETEEMARKYFSD